MFMFQNVTTFSLQKSNLDLLLRKAGLDWELLFLETEYLFPKKYCFESNEKKCLEEIKKALFKN